MIGAGGFPPGYAVSFFYNWAFTIVQNVFISAYIIFPAFLCTVTPEWRTAFCGHPVHPYVLS